MHILRIVLVGIITVLAAAGCQDMPMPGALTEQLNQGKELLGLTTATPTSAASTPQPQLTVESTQGIVVPVQPTLTIWLPPEFDPQSASASSQLINSRLIEFQNQNPGIQINMRIKAAEGPGGALDMLRTASKAAPLALPSLVLLNRNSFLTAVEEELVFPISGDSTDTSSDWYAYAEELRLVNGIQFGYPFAGDAMLLVHRPGVIEKENLTNWEDILASSTVLLFPAADNRAMLTLDLYLSQAGSLFNENEQVSLDSDMMQTVLNLHQSGAESELFPYWLSQFDNDMQTWKAYQDRQGDIVVGWISQYLNELPADSSAISLPGMTGIPFSLADGWVFAISEPDADKQGLANQLAEFMVDPAFLAKFTMSAGYLPVRPSTTAAFTDQIVQNLLEETAVNALLVPDNQIFEVISPELRDAVLSIIKQQADVDNALETLLNNISAQ